jgi:hypothetical protein
LRISIAIPKAHLTIESKGYLLSFLAGTITKMPVMDVEANRVLILLSLPCGDDNEIPEAVSKCLLIPYLHDCGSYAAEDENHGFTRLALFDIAGDISNIALPRLLNDLSTQNCEKSKSHVHHRIYKLLSDNASPGFRRPGKILLAVGMQPGEDLAEKEFHSWYEEEHTPLFTKIPGWQRTRRFEIVHSDSKAPRYLALHEWESMASFSSKEYKHAVNTVWRNSVVRRVDQSTRERWILERV